MKFNLKHYSEFEISLQNSKYYEIHNRLLANLYHIKPASVQQSDMPQKEKKQS